MSAQLTQKQLDELKEVFDSFDADGNGSLSRDEVANVLRSLGMNPSDEDLEAIFIHVDTDFSNTIEFPEFSQWIAKKVDLTSKEDLREIFQLIDLDGSGAISTDELRKLFNALNIDWSDDEITQLIQQADTDRNGLIEYDEFIKSKGLWTRIKLTVRVIHSFYVQAEFDSLARTYDQLIRLWVPWYDENIAVTLDNLPTQASAPRVLDLGCGTGNLSAALLERYPQAEVHLVDSSNKMINFSKQRFAEEQRMHFHEQDFMTLDFGESVFDHIISHITIHHLDDVAKKQLFQRVHEWLMPGGVFSYCDIFRGIRHDIHERHIAQWQKASYKLGATEEQWNHFMYHDQRYDQHTSITATLDWLREAGFVEIDVTWRRSLWSNIVARKAR